MRIPSDSLLGPLEGLLTGRMRLRTSAAASADSARSCPPPSGGTARLARHSAHAYTFPPQPEFTALLCPSLSRRIPETRNSPLLRAFPRRDGSPMWCTYTSGRDAQFPANGLDSSVAREELDSVDFPEKAAVEAGDGSSIQPRVVPPEKVPPEGSVHAAFFAELDERGEIKNAPLSGRRLQRLATAAAAQGIRDPRVWASLSAQAIELNCASLGRLHADTEAGKDAHASRTKTASALEPAGAADASAPASEATDGSLTQQGGNSTQASSSAALAPAAQMFRHFEALQFLNSFLAAGFKDTDLLRSFEQIFLRQLHAFDCRHLLLLLHICEQHAYRARSLYLPLLRTLGALAPSLLFQEIADVFCCFATYQVGSSRCCLSLLKAAAAQVPNASLTDCSRLCGALHALRLAPEHEKVDKAASAVADAAGKPPQETCDSAVSAAAFQQRMASSSKQGAMEEAAWTVLALIERRVAFLIVGLPLQLLLDEVQTMPRLEFSWRPYETLADVELQKRLASLESAEDVDQLADPFATLQFLRNQGTVQQHNNDTYPLFACHLCAFQEFLKALIRWCAAAVYRPATRSQKRPTAEELVMLHDMCREHGIQDDRQLQKAIHKFVSTQGEIGGFYILPFESHIKDANGYSGVRPLFLESAIAEGEAYAGQRDASDSFPLWSISAIGSTFTCRTSGRVIALHAVSLLRGTSLQMPV
ncbi:hypothetical protein cyc_06406 [Cyclospora cayetanensis]|uniref:Uncharacterized protein n=1 Tax=Cyclospora cayetanensis TaxID=88456 RepID=A0A1D3CTA2_9EIME|nr:hypothetical protein cyc_06406 [Cyclospora cayetanensis]